ncbi:MAG: glutamate 5-kinase [Hyphomicrobiaceae bacterium]|nr:glutamate 5-kinase [Hyphomicrobiaceae bacterium]
MKPEWHSAKRIIIKIGSSLLIDERGLLKAEWLSSLISDIARLSGEGREIVLVSSGAIGLGRRQLGLAAGVLKLEESQAAASVGQITLAHAYEERLKAHDLIAAQVLVTLGDTEERRRYLNARGTISTLLKIGAVPVVNENDTVATSEIRFGDNDRLAARVASMMTADLLILLSDIDGLYTKPPQKEEGAEHLSEVPEITPEIEAMAGSVGSDYGSGGMTTKILAAKIATKAGVHMLIASGQGNHPVSALFEGGRHTWFHAHGNPVTSRKRWIAGGLESCGELIIDEGAATALQRGKSLLPAGITSLSGDFGRGDVVIIRDPEGREVARGLCAYGIEDAAKIIGRHSKEISALLGYQGRAAMIHRDDMVLL